MISGSPLGWFEDSSHFDETEPSLGISGGDTKSLSGRLSFARSQQTQVNFSFFFCLKPPRIHPCGPVGVRLPLNTHFNLSSSTLINEFFTRN